MYQQTSHAYRQDKPHVLQRRQKSYEGEEMLHQNSSSKLSAYHNTYHKHQPNGLGSNASRLNAEFGISETSIIRSKANLNNTATTLMDNKTGNQFHSQLANLSQGSCDNTPDTPDSLDSLVGSENEGVGAVHREDDEDHQLSIAEAEASSQSLDVHSPLSPDRGIFSSLGGAPTADLTNEFLLPVSQCINSGHFQSECLPDSLLINSPKYTTSPFPSGLDEHNWKNSTGNLSSCQVSQRDNLIEEVSTPVPTSQQRNLMDNNVHPSQALMQPFEQKEYVTDLNEESMQRSNKDNVLSSATGKCVRSDVLTDPYVQPLLSSSCSPTLGYSEKSTPTAARTSTSSTTSVTPPLISPHSRSDYAFENPSVITTNIELSNATESDKLSCTTPFSSNKSSLCSTSPSSNFTSTLCAQSSSTTPICKLPQTTSIPSNCSSLVSSQTSFNHNESNNPNTFKHQTGRECEGRYTGNDSIKTYGQRIVQDPSCQSNTCQNNVEPRKMSPLKVSTSSTNNNNKLIQNTLCQVYSPSRRAVDSTNYKKENDPYTTDNNNKLMSGHQMSSKYSNRENSPIEPITKQPLRMSDCRIQVGHRDTREKNINVKQYTNNATSSSPQTPRTGVRITTDDEGGKQFSGTRSNRADVWSAKQNVAPTQKGVSWNTEEASTRLPHQTNDNSIRNQQQHNYATTFTQQNVGELSGGDGFVLHPSKTEYGKETNFATNQEYYNHPQQPIYMAIIPPPGHQMIPGNLRTAPSNQSPSCGYRNNHARPQQHSHILASPTIISGLPYSESPHYATLGRLAKDKFTGNMVFISCDASGNPHRVDPAIIHGRSPVLLRTSSSNPQLQTGGVGNLPRQQMSRSMSQDQSHINAHIRQPAHPKAAPVQPSHAQYPQTQVSPILVHKQYPKTQVSPILVHKQTQGHPQEVSNRYATISRHNHKLRQQNTQQNPSPQVQRLHQDLQSTMRKRAQPNSSSVRVTVESPPIKQSHANMLNARLVNHNLASTYLPQMTSSGDTADKFEARESLPLADVRKMATNVILQQPFPQSSIPVPDQNRQRLDITPMDTNPSPRSPDKFGRRIDALYTEKDLRAHESESGSDQVDEEEEEDEDKIREEASLPTILMPKPKRKPPFTIEGAMNSILKRNKKPSKENTLDNVKFENDNDENQNRNINTDNMTKEDTNTEEKSFFAFLHSDRNSSNNNNDDNSNHNTRKKRSSFSFSKLRVNLNRTNAQQPINDNDNGNNLPTTTVDNTPFDEKDMDFNSLDRNSYSKDEADIDASPHHNVNYHKFTSMERRREVRLLKHEEEGEKHLGSSNKYSPYGSTKMAELDKGLSITSPGREHSMESNQHNISNSSTTSHESFDTRISKPDYQEDTLNNTISNRFKKRWRKTKKPAPPPPPPIKFNDKQIDVQIQSPMTPNLLPNGHVLGGGKCNTAKVVGEVSYNENISNVPNDDIRVAETETRNRKFEGDISRIDNEIQNERSTYEIIGTRREALEDELLVDLRDIDKTNMNDNIRPEDREPFPSSPLSEERRNSKQVSKLL